MLRGKMIRKVRVFEVVITRDPNARTPYKYMADVPAIRNCFTDGRTRKEALENIKEVISLMLSQRARHRAAKNVAIVEVPA